jgi:hypothetical protein
MKLVSRRRGPEPHPFKGVVVLWASRLACAHCKPTPDAPIPIAATTTLEDMAQDVALGKRVRARNSA